MAKTPSGPCSYSPGDYYEVKIMQTVFRVPRRYTDIVYHGSGAFSSVAKAYDNELNRNVAIKKLSKPFYDAEYAKRTYREIYMLSHLNHPNIICLIDVFSPQFGVGELKDVYLVIPWMEADLKRVLKQYSKLSEEHVKFFAYQMFLAIRYLHAMSILHRDIKPANLAINQDNDFKILDFGLARKLEVQLTGYVVTRWYRSPEILVNWEHYSFPIDLWSAGCVIAEMLIGKPLFPGEDAPNLIALMCGKLGKPNEEMMSKIHSEHAAKFIREIDVPPPPSFETLFPNVSDQMRDLIRKLLIFDPDYRLTAEQALAHPLFAEFRKETAKPKHFPTTQLDCSFEKIHHTVQEWRAMVEEFMKHFQPNLQSLNHDELSDCDEDDDDDDDHDHGEGRV